MEDMLDLLIRDRAARDEFFEMLDRQENRWEIDSAVCAFAKAHDVAFEPTDAEDGLIEQLLDALYMRQDITPENRSIVEAIKMVLLGNGWYAGEDMPIWFFGPDGERRNFFE